MQAGRGQRAPVSGACKKHRLFYAPDPSSQTACTIGGNVGNNSGGPHCFKYGSTSRHVLDVTLVDSNGDVQVVGTKNADPVGLDWLGTIVGSEGMLGLVTEITVKLLPVPDEVETLLVMFESARRVL